MQAARCLINELVGQELIRPFQRDRKADFAAASEEVLVRSAIGQILGTMGSSEFTSGEILWRPQPGRSLSRLCHQKNDHVLQKLARTYAVDALKRWEPRVRVTSVQATREQYDGETVRVMRLRIGSSLGWFND